MSQHVVIVDDDDLTLKLFAGIAREIGDVSVHPFLSSTEALDWCRENEVDCVVCDYNMPPPNGLQLISLLREMPKFALVPIVIVTGAHEREIRYLALDAGANDFLQKPVDYREMLARLTTLLALEAAQKRLALQVGSLEASLLDAEERSRQHAERLETLWRIANNPNLQEDELMLAMLQQGAAAVRPGQPYRAMLGRVEGANLHILSTGNSAGYIDNLGLAETGPGALILLSDSMTGEMVRTGSGTQSFDDIQVDERGKRRLRAHAHGWRAMIMTTFTAGGETYVLAFASNQPTSQHFGPQDHAYIEVLASFFATHYYQRWQSSRIGHQLDHDSLTGLWNRSRFRSLGRAAFHDGERPAIAIVDLVAFNELNEAHGHLIGDAVLVEVAAALAAEATTGEIVARVGGDSFAIFFPVAASREWLVAAVNRYGSIFDQPMSIGDRDGKETLRVAARVGVAVAPDDAATFDALLFRAEARAGTSSVHPDRLLFPAGTP